MYVRQELRYRNIGHLSKGDDLHFTPKCVVHNKNGSPLYNTMFILFDIHILYDSKTFVFVVITNALTSIANPPTQ